jgi:hypothetical protein
MMSWIYLPRTVRSLTQENLRRMETRIGARRKFGNSFQICLRNSPDPRYQQVEPDWSSAIAPYSSGIARRPRDGKRQDWLGCDLFTFDGSLIKRKNTYFKITT